MTVADMIAKLDPDDSGELQGGHFIRNTKTGGTVWVRDGWTPSTGVGMFKSRDAVPEDTNMTLSNEHLLQKALESGADLSADSADFGTKGALGIDQVAEFLRLMANEQVILPDVKRVTSAHAKWQENVIASGGRMLRAGVESTVGATTKPVVTAIEMNTGFFKAIVPVSDEFFEDAAGTEGGAKSSIAATIADQVGSDVEDLALNSKAADDDFNSNDAVYDILPDGGWLAQVDAGPGFYDAAADGQDFQSVFRQLLTSLPVNRRQGLVKDGRFYVPTVVDNLYRDALSARGTNLGDVTLQGTNPLSYQGIGIVAVPNLYVRTSSTPDTSHILLANRTNLLYGVQRDIRIEYFRDPREGTGSWVVTVRFDAKVAVPDATAAAEHVNVDV